jgi:hypothetical protein
MIQPTPEQRAEMAAFIDAKQPGLLDELGIERDDHATSDVPDEWQGLPDYLLDDLT